MNGTRTSQEPAAGKATSRRKNRKKSQIITLICAIAVIGAAVPAILFLRSQPSGGSRQPVRYLGVYERTSPASYAGVQQFATATGVKPNVVMYYSAWRQPFDVSFANAAASHGAIPLVQMNPYGVNLADIAAGQDDGYLAGYARAVRAYHRPVIMGFGHEMNGHWYPWGYGHTSPAVFVQAWRRVVTVFRSQGASNVRWLWTVNIIDQSGDIPAPGRWWPGRSYVTWVGIDGYYYTPTNTFASLFGPTITAVRELTSDPILISETAVKPAANQSAKIPDLFAGIHLYGLLGLVWFAAEDWRLGSPAAIDAFRHGADAYRTADHGR